MIEELPCFSELQTQSRIYSNHSTSRADAKINKTVTKSSNEQNFVTVKICEKQLKAIVSKKISLKLKVTNIS